MQGQLAFQCVLLHYSLLWQWPYSARVLGCIEQTYKQHLRESRLLMVGQHRQRQHPVLGWKWGWAGEGQGGVWWGRGEGEGMWVW